MIVLKSEDKKFHLHNTETLKRTEQMSELAAVRMIKSMRLMGFEVLVECETHYKVNKD